MLVPIEDIRVGKRLRGLRQAAVTELVESISRTGLRTPISVAKGIEKRPGNSDGVAFDLVAGNHRLEACRRLGWQEIEADIVQMSPDECLLWEIDENLCRADLTELERGEHLAQRKAVYERLHPGAKQHIAGALAANAAMGNASANLAAASFAEDVADKIGASDRTVHRAIRRATKIDEKVRDRIRDNPEIANNGSELDALASLDRELQKKAVSMVEAGTAESVRQAKRLIEQPARPLAGANFKSDAVEEQREYETLVKAWNRARASVKDRFINECLDVSVADNAGAWREAS